MSTHDDDRVWLDGQVMAADEARVSVFDHGLTTGDGVFETMKVVEGVPFALTRHLRRLDNSLAGMGLTLPVSEDALRDAIGELLTDWRHPLARLRITVTGGLGPLGSGRGSSGELLVLAVQPLQPQPPTTTVVTVPWPRNELAATAGLKSTSYADNVIALSRAAAAGATEALMRNIAGNLCEGTGSNVFVVVDGEVCTPPLSSGCLAGVTRALVVELAELRVVERDLPFDVLERASEVFLTSSLRDVQGIAAIDGRSYPAPGPVTERAMELFVEAYATTPDP